MSTIDSVIDSNFQKHKLMIAEVSNHLPVVKSMAHAICESLSAGKKVLICGNGGSAADAQHFAAELVGRFVRTRRALPAIALSVDTSALTSIGNDFGFEMVFSRQVEALGHEGDILFAISTSGNSSNILAAVETARQRRMKIFGFTGNRVGKLSKLCDLCLEVPSDETSRIQEAHIFAIHCICAAVDHHFSH